MCIAVAYLDIVNQTDVSKIGRIVWQVVKSMSIIRCRTGSSMPPAYVMSMLSNLCMIQQGLYIVDKSRQTVVKSRTVML